MSKEWKNVRLGEVLSSIARPVAVSPDEQYRQIGIRSHGKGVFHKAPVSGLELGNKKVFWVEPGDFIVNIVFAWEGAIALMTDHESEMIGSHRFPSFRAENKRLHPQFLVYFFNTPAGIELLGRVSPGGAGRNRTLSKSGFLNLEIPLPPLTEQRRIVARIEALAAQIGEARRLRKEALEEAEAMVFSATCASIDEKGWQQCSLDEVLSEKPRNGLGPQPETGGEGTPMLRINAVSSSLTKFIDMTVFKMVEVSPEVAAPFAIQNDDVFIVRYNGDINRVAKPAIYKGGNAEKAVFPDKLIRLRSDRNRIDPEFLVAALSTRTVRKQVEALGKTTAGNIGVSGANARSFQLHLPPLPEQRRIVAELDALQEQVDTLKRLQSETAAELAALLPSILDRAFKGEL